MSGEVCTCDDGRFTVCHQFGTEPHYAGCPRWGTPARPAAGDTRTDRERLREAVAETLRGHRWVTRCPGVGLRCLCGGWQGPRPDYQRHIAEAVLATREVAALLDAAEKDAEKVQRVEGIHVPYHGYCVACDDGRDTETVGNNPDCPHRTSFCASCDLAWPCPTRRALDGQP